MSEIVDKIWSYTKQAKYYEYRPNYADRAIDILKFYVSEDADDNFNVADIGAGTGNLSIMLLARNLKTTSIEPNDAMREIGIERTQGHDIKWVKATGIETTLPDSYASWVTFGSSFNVMDRDEALKETYRILKPNGYFSCMWNNRDLEDPIQKEAESIIESFVPDYERGVRREDQRPVIEKNDHLFKDIFAMEVDFVFKQTIDNFINAWRSVKNKYWDLETDEGNKLFDQITGKMREVLPENLEIKYTTKCWTAQKK